MLSANDFKKKQVIFLMTNIGDKLSFSNDNVIVKDKEGKIKYHHDWSLSNFIDVAHELRYIQEDVKKFSHTLRDFRNYIHPYEQMSSGFNPDINTAKLCWNVFKVAMIQLAKKK